MNWQAILDELERKRAFAPFDRLHEPSEPMRRAVVSVLRRAVAAGRRAWVIVNNKAEGCSPETVMALARAMAGDSGAHGGGL